MSKEKEARNIALREYDEFIGKYKEGVEAGNPKLLMHMLKLEANKIRTQDILDTIEKSTAGIDENIYDFEKDKMKIQMDSAEYHKDQARENAFIKMATTPIIIGDPDEVDHFKIDKLNLGQVDSPTKKAPSQEPVNKTPSIEIDPKTGKKIYKGPKLRSRKIVDGKTWDSSHPDFYNEGGGV